MEEFQRQLKEYAFPDSIEITKKYLKKYWLSKSEYFDKWKSTQFSIFSLNNKFPKMVINHEFELLIRKGGLLFDQEEFETLKECIVSTKDKNIFIIEDYDDINPPHKPPHKSGHIIRLKFPANITWKEINIGDGFSYELFQRPVRNYYVFGDSGNWGKYVANDYEYPLDIFCFNKKYIPLFYNKFKNTIDEQKELRNWLPPAYK